uniref:Transferrin n=1 Tax=Diabrotica virgifera virgifera TaxID=50390 RepID=A0A6P7F5N0_DIAVI
MTRLAYFSTCCIVFVGVLAVVSCEKYKLCVVDGKGSLKKSQRYCPDLDVADSKVECVVAPDRTDCLRQILKGKADFSVFSPEDLVAANNEGVQILVTNELRYVNTPFDYEVVAVVDKKSGIKSRHDLKGKNYCHPGHGYETDWTKILANFFEASVTTPSCDPLLSLSENRVKATSDFFGAACKAGPWVHDPILDIQLKRKYTNLCDLCGDPEKCSMDDKYWGRRGSLYCLTDGAGDISWARLDDVRPHFGLVPGSPEASADGYYFLCPNDSIMPLNSTNPCVWVVKPWPVVATRRTVADDIQKIVSPLSHSDRISWRYSLLMLLETAYTTFYKLPNIDPIETYLDHATGYLSANSFSGCHPPRTITICTTSIKEHAKCSWMRESASVYGIEPDLECVKADNKTHCMWALNNNNHNQYIADVVIVPTDLVHQAQTKYNLTTLFYETVLDNEKYITVAATTSKTKMTSMEDVRGKKICFPVYDGVAWNTVKNVLFNKSVIHNCPLDKEMANFFGPSCTPGVPKRSGFEKLEELCQGDTFDGELGALHCLASGKGDVAFVSQNSISKFIAAYHANEVVQIQASCINKTSACHLSWAPVGQAMVRGNATELWKKDTLDVFLQLDELFGKNYKSTTNAFTMFGRYDDEHDLLFHDVTEKLRTVPTLKENDPMPFVYETSLNSDRQCLMSGSSNSRFTFSLFLFVTCLYLVYSVKNVLL